jgi:hypothetical protein
MNAARQRLGSELIPQFANLPAEGGLGGMKPTRGGHRKAGLLEDGDEVTQAPQLHDRFMPWRYAPGLQSLFRDRYASLESPAWKQGS